MACLFVSFVDVFWSRMITLKVLNSIVLLGRSCVFVKEADMEEKLFDPPPSAVSSRVNSRAHRTKHVHIVPPQGSNRCTFMSFSKILEKEPVLPLQARAVTCPF